MQRHGWKGRLVAFATVVGIAVATTTGAAEARRSLRADMDLHITVPSQVYDTEKGLVTYVGTLDFGRRAGEFGIVFYAGGDPNNPPPPPRPFVGDLVQWNDTYEIYDSTTFFEVDDAGLLTMFDPPDPILVISEWGFGHVEHNWFVSFGRVIDADTDDVRLFRRVDEGDRAFWQGEYTGPLSFAGTVRVYGF